ncbi:MAG: class I SAM-dependent RNA methyltransferase [Spirochaetaceae bacterium]|jgi:putative N6-adenine-specific DNA methylase|nr:class I SAM-dependent RNA methyltransferase [Spirochaetaceae bacterium]
MTAVVLCALGAEKVLSNEIKKLASFFNINFIILESFFGRLRIKTDNKGLYFLLIGLRTADRVLIELASYPAEDFGALFDGAALIDAENFIPRGSGLIIDKVRSRSSKLFSGKSIQSIVHKALAERLCSKYKMNRLPEDSFNAKIRVYLERNRVSVLLDISGDPLYKRAYRLQGGLAPLRESAAAAIILLSSWKRKYPLYDPFCGSGTIALEAALYACDIAPGLGRQFSIDKLLIADKQKENEVRSLYRERINLSNIVRITGSDKDNAAIEIAKQNAARAWDIYGLAKHKEKNDRLLVFNKSTMEDARSFDDNGFIITNPPYGNRLGDKQEAEENYKNMPVLQKNFQGWNIVVISDNIDFENFFGSKAETKKEITDGAYALYIYTYNKNMIRDEHENKEEHEHEHESGHKKNTLKDDHRSEKKGDIPRDEYGSEKKKIRHTDECLSENEPQKKENTKRQKYTYTW